MSALQQYVSLKRKNTRRRLPSLRVFLLPESPSADKLHQYKRWAPGSFHEPGGNRLTVPAIQADAQGCCRVWSSTLNDGVQSTDFSRAFSLSK